METENKFYETGFNPYYLNLNNTAKDFSLNESTNPQSGLMNTLINNTIIENDTIILHPVLEDDMIIQDVFI